MVLCASVKKKGSLDQCTAKALAGHTLCGNHARCKHVTLWAAVNKPKEDSIVRIQRHVRGWLLRCRLKRCGPGVLCRKNLANDEDLETCEESSKQDPFDYFAFEESGKIWWFDFNTLWRWCLRSQEPTNPYTKVPLSVETRKRLRATWSYQLRHNLPLPAESVQYLDRFVGRWNIICQLFADHGFGNIHADTFCRLRKAEMLVAYQFLQSDMNVVLNPKTRTHRFVMARTEIVIRNARTIEPNRFVLIAAHELMKMLLYPKDPYILAFTVLSALYRC